MQLEIESLSHDGKGVARVGGKVVFVPGALAGETVDAELTQRRSRFDEYRLLRVVEPAPDRVAPMCPLVGTCGGCDLQHLAGAAQLAHKQAAVLELLQRQAGLSPARIDAPIASPAFGYRQRARLALFVPRRGGRLRLGFRETAGSRVVPVERCPVLEPVLEALPGRLAPLLGALRRPGQLGHVELYASESRDGGRHALIHLRSVAPLEVPDRDALAAFAAAESAYVAVREGDGPSVYLHRPVAEDPGYRLPAFDLRIGFEPGDFLQGNAVVNRELVSRALAWLEAPAGGRVLDAFAGLGNFSLPLAQRGFDVLAVEGTPEMVRRARDNAAANHLGNVEFRVRDLDGDAGWLRREGLSAALLDPPRAGARTLVEALARLRLEQILYVSCAPATLARDAALLAASGYRLERLCLVDMFPQTRHIETMALFRHRR